MWRFRSFTYHLGAMTYTLLSVLLDAARFFMLCLRPAPALAAENLFLRKQLAQYQERQVKPRRANDATRIALVWLSRFFDWRMALAIEAWTTRSTQGLANPHATHGIREPTWGQVRIANELLLKLGLKVSPRTVRKYMPDHCVGGLGKRSQSQRWSTFLRNHAKSIIACDFCVAVTATFRVLYMFVIIADPEFLGGKPIVA
jgi:hypothetical protein